MPGSAALIAGRKRAVPTPANNARATVAVNEGINASAMNALARSRSPATARRRRETLSASEPNTGDKTIPGRNSPRSTSEIAHPECSR